MTVPVMTEAEALTQLRQLLRPNAVIYYTSVRHLRTYTISRLYVVTQGEYLTDISTLVYRALDTWHQQRFLKSPDALWQYGIQPLAYKLYCHREALRLDFIN